MIPSIQQKEKRKEKNVPPSHQLTPPTEKTREIEVGKRAEESIKGAGNGTKPTGKNRQRSASRRSGAPKVNKINYNLY